MKGFDLLGVVGERVKSAEKTKRLHWFNFGLHEGRESLHESYSRFAFAVERFTCSSDMVGRAPSGR